MLKRFPIMALYLAALLVVAGGTTAYGVLNKTFDVTIDGETETVRTFGDSVENVLESKGVKLRERDSVSHELDHQVADGDDIVVRYARPLSLSVDGETKEEWVFDRTVEQALERENIDPEAGAYFSDEPDAEIPRSGLDLVVSNPKDIEIKVDGETEELNTPAPTVGSVLEEADIEVKENDEVDPGADALVTEDLTLEVVRVTTETKDEKVEIDFETEVRDNSEMPKGETEVIREGEKGEKLENVTVTTADGEVRERKVNESEVLKEPVTQIEERGTMEAPSAPSAPSVSDGSVWDRLAQCESGGNWQTNSGNGYYGGIQFSAQTWSSVGGSGLPHENSREEQIKRGKILQERSGWGQWPACASKLGLN